MNTAERVDSAIRVSKADNGIDFKLEATARHSVNAMREALQWRCTDRVKNADGSVTFKGEGWSVTVG